MAKTGVLSSDPTLRARARAAELKKELQRLVKTIVDDEDCSVQTIDQAKHALCALRELKFNTRSSATTMTSSLKLHEPLPCPQEFICPLSKKLMRDPVVLSSGQTYERPFIEKWLKAGNRTCPQTQQVLSHTVLTPNHLVSEMISQWCKSQGIELPDPVQNRIQEGVTEAERHHFFSLLDKLSAAALPQQKEAAKELRLLTKNMPSFRSLFGESVDAIPQLLTPLSGTKSRSAYYNNYSPSQPRHFCKTCRRYWTRGGALRNVPVGGGCRRNKKNKSSSSKSTGSAEKQGGSNSTNAVNNNIPSEITGHLPQQTPHLPFMASLQSFSQFGMGNIGLNFGASANGGQAEMGFHIGTNSGMSSPILSSAGHQQFPFFEPTNGLYSLQSEGMEGSSSMVGESQLLRSITSSSRVSQLAPVKMENSNNQGLNLSGSMMNNASDNNQYWGGNNWTDLSGLNASNTNHLL